VPAEKLTNASPLELSKGGLVRAIVELSALNVPNPTSHSFEVFNEMA
ncbi:uncharacterized protein METZ01_LOCUS176861, partial [marine metagenome]